VSALCLGLAAAGPAGRAVAGDDGSKPGAPAPPPAPDGPGKDKDPKDAAPADAAAVAKLTPEERARRLAAAMKRVSAALSKVKSVRAGFVQTKRLEVFGRDVVSRGTLALQVPDLFRWETTEPLRTELVIAGESGVRRRVSRKGETTETPFELAKDPVAAATVQQIFLWTTGDFAKASRSYAIELVSEAPLVVLAKPSDERIGKVVRSVEVEFSPEPVRLKRVTLTEQSGAASVIAFHDVAHDPALPRELFALTRPDGK